MGQRNTETHRLETERQRDRGTEGKRDRGAQGQRDRRQRDRRQRDRGTEGQRDRMDRGKILKLYVVFLYNTILIPVNIKSHRIFDFVLFIH